MSREAEALWKKPSVTPPSIISRGSGPNKVDVRRFLCPAAWSNTSLNARATTFAANWLCGPSRKSGFAASRSLWPLVLSYRRSYERDCPNIRRVVSEHCADEDQCSIAALEVLQLLSDQRWIASNPCEDVDIRAKRTETHILTVAAARNLLSCAEKSDHREVVAPYAAVCLFRRPTAQAKPSSWIGLRCALKPRPSKCWPTRARLVIRDS